MRAGVRRVDVAAEVVGVGVTAAATREAVATPPATSAARPSTSRRVRPSAASSTELSCEAVLNVPLARTHSGRIHSDGKRRAGDVGCREDLTVALLLVGPQHDPRPAGELGEGGTQRAADAARGRGEHRQPDPGCCREPVVEAGRRPDRRALVVELQSTGGSDRAQRDGPTRARKQGEHREPPRDDRAGGHDTQRAERRSSRNRPGRQSSAPAEASARRSGVPCGEQPDLRDREERQQSAGRVAGNGSRLPAIRRPALPRRR